MDFIVLSHKPLGNFQHYTVGHSRRVLTVRLCNLYLYSFTTFALVWWWYMNTKTVFHCSQTISNMIFRLIPNRPSCVLWRRPCHTCRWELPVSTRAHAAWWYTTAAPRRESTSSHSYDFSVLPSVAYLAQLPPASSLPFLTSVSSKKCLWRESWQLESTQICLEGRCWWSILRERQFRPQCVCKLKPTRQLFHL